MVPTDTGRDRLPWAALALWALVGTLIGTGLTLLDLERTRAINGGLVHTGPTGPAAELLARDFPEMVQTTNGEHDGAMFYAFARNLFELDTVAQSLDRPRYRLQRPLYPALAWALDPTGAGGDRLVWSMFAVNVLAAFGGAVALGALSATLRGPTWIGVLLPLLPGSLTSMRISVADLLAVALMLAATVTFLRDRWWWALAFAVLAVLAKEPVLITFVGLAIWARTRRAALTLLGAPLAIAGVWYLFLRFTQPDSGQDVVEFGLPLRGIVDAVRLVWLPGPDYYAMGSFLAFAMLTLVVAVRRTPAHPLWWAAALNVAFVLPLGLTVIGLDRNGPRALLPGTVVLLACAVAPAHVPARRATTGANVSSTSAPTVT